MTTLSEMLFPSSSGERQRYSHRCSCSSPSTDSWTSTRSFLVPPSLPSKNDDGWFKQSWFKPKEEEKVEHTRKQRLVLTSEERIERRRTLGREAKRRQRDREAYLLKDGGGSSIKPHLHHIVRCDGCGEIAIVYANFKSHYCRNCGKRIRFNKRTIESYVLSTTWSYEEALQLMVNYVVGGDYLTKKGGFFIYKVPTEQQIEAYRREILRKRDREETAENKRRRKGTWMVVVCPDGHFNAVAYATRFHCETCGKDFTLPELVSRRKDPSPDEYWFKSDWRGTDGYWSQNKWQKARVFQDDLNEEQARQLLRQLEVL